MILGACQPLRRLGRNMDESVTPRLEHGRQDHLESKVVVARVWRAFPPYPVFRITLAQRAAAQHTLAITQHVTCSTSKPGFHHGAATLAIMTSLNVGGRDPSILGMASSGVMMAFMVLHYMADEGDHGFNDPAFWVLCCPCWPCWASQVSFT